MCVVPHDSSDRSLKAGVMQVARRAAVGGLCVSLHGMLVGMQDLGAAWLFPSSRDVSAMLSQGGEGLICPPHQHGAGQVLAQVALRRVCVFCVAKHSPRVCTLFPVPSLAEMGVLSWNGMQHRVAEAGVGRWAVPMYFYRDVFCCVEELCLAMLLISAFGCATSAFCPGASLAQQNPRQPGAPPTRSRHRHHNVDIHG